MKKRVVVAVSTGAVLFGAAAALAAVPLSGCSGGSCEYSGTGKSEIVFGVIAKKHSFDRGGEGRYGNHNWRKPCNSKFGWEIGYSESGGVYVREKVIKLTNAYTWSTTRLDQDSAVYPHKIKITVTGRFTSQSGGSGTYKVGNCAKHRFTFTVGRPGGVA